MYPVYSAINLPEYMYVTDSDLDYVNKNNVFSPFVKLNFDNDIEAGSLDFGTRTVDVNLFNLFTIKKIEVNYLKDEEVTVGGNAVGFSLNSDGVIVVGTNPVFTIDGEKNPLNDSGIIEGDVITEIADTKIKNITDIDDVINSLDNRGRELPINVMRDEKLIELKITPALDLLSGKYKLGMWVKNSTSGVGTITYIKDNGRFGAVGHPITDANFKESYDLGGGKVYLCKLLGIKKGTKLQVGELRGSLDLSEDAIGVADTNCKYGVYGNLNSTNQLDVSRKAHLGGRLSIKCGKAQIYVALDGIEAKPYDIEIVKTNTQKKADEKSLVLRITDEELLEKTGGIVQGMSGSPIVQDGKLIGAVTHVFVGEPTMGYGVYIDWMINN